MLKKLNESMLSLLSGGLAGARGRRPLQGRAPEQLLTSDFVPLEATQELFAPTPCSPLSKDFQRIADIDVLRLHGEFWTSGQRRASSLHEISYRACFKPQLPRYFINRFCTEGDTVYDPFGGRGTTAVEAGLLARNVISNDVNPLSTILTEPRLFPPTTGAVEQRLNEISYPPARRADIDLSMFYHPDTESEIVALQSYLVSRREDGREDDIDRWIRMVATNRLTGHSPGFFSVYTFPPNQAVSADSQRRINKKRNQIPEYRDTKKIILKKTQSLLSRVTEGERAALKTIARRAQFHTCDARTTRGISNKSVQLTVTSPPFLDTVGYAGDNWLRCWFNNIDLASVNGVITTAKRLDEWTAVMADVFKELYRITKRGGWVAFEVGEIRNGTIKLEEHVVPLGCRAGFSCVALMINAQNFTKTSHIWGVKNNRGGINSNRIVLFRRD